MQMQQDPTNVVAHRGSSAEFSRWRDQGVDPEYLTTPPVQAVGISHTLMERMVALDASHHPVGGHVALNAALRAENLAEGTV